MADVPTTVGSFDMGEGSEFDGCGGYPAAGWGIFDRWLKLSILPSKLLIRSSISTSVLSFLKYRQLLYLS